MTTTRTLAPLIVATVVCAIYAPWVLWIGSGWLLYREVRHHQRRKR